MRCRSDSDAYIVVKGEINVEGTVNTNKRNKRLTLTFRLDHAYQKSVTIIDNAEDLDIVMPMYSLSE